MFYMNNKNKIKMKILEKTKNNLGFPIDNLTKHTFIIGATGVGKTVILKRIYVQLKNRKHSGSFSFIVHDTKGDWIEQFYTKETGYILNPLDQRSVVFNIFSLVENKANFDEIAQALIPDGKGDAIWFNSARSIFTAILIACIDDYVEGRSEELNNSRIREYVFMPLGTLLKRIKGLEGAEQTFAMLEKNGTQEGNFYSNFSTYMKAFTIMIESKNEEINIKDFIEKSQGKTIFLPNFLKIKAFVSPLLTLFLNFVVNGVCDQEATTSSNKTYLFLDELGELNKINNLINFLALTRSFGGAAFIGIQDSGRIQDLYGENHIHTIFANVVNKFFFQVGDVKTQKDCSDILGSHIVKYFSRTHSVSKIDRDGINYNQQETNRKLMDGSELGSLVEHEFIFSTRGIKGWVHVKGKWLDEYDVFPKIADKIILVKEFKVNKERKVAYVKPKKEIEEKIQDKNIETSKSEDLLGSIETVVENLN